MVVGSLIHLVHNLSNRPGGILSVCLYGVPWLARFAEISPPQKFHSITYNVLSFVYMRATAWLGEIPPLLSRDLGLTGLVFLHINSAARAGSLARSRAGSRADIVYNINFKYALMHSLTFEAGWRRNRSRQASR